MISYLVIGSLSFLEKIVVTVNEAGKKGGQTVLQKHGRQFFVDIGKRGNIAMRAKYWNMASEWGKKGGRPRKPTLIENTGGVKQITVKGGCGPA